MQATLPFTSATDAELQEILSKERIGLTVEEARKITTFLGRDPTITEAVIWGIQGSEHCSYKSSRRFLKSLPTENKHIILGPREDSGIVAITDGPKGKRWGLVIAHESHNSPSQIVPFEGAATGVGGVVRDVLCMGARVIGCMDMLRFGDLSTEESKTIASEAARGIAGYGNPLGIPNMGGDVQFGPAYNTCCLVNAVALGLVREVEVIHSTVPAEAGEVGYDIILIGKATDRSGFGGASFSSRPIDEQLQDENVGAVQEPNPFLERVLLASTYALFDWLAATKNLHRVSFKDLGAGGVVCASVEQVADEGFGAVVGLDKVHVGIPDLPAQVIACAETQERLCWIVHPELTQHILKHYNEDWELPRAAPNAGASCIGKVTTDGMFRLTHKGDIVCEAKATDITSGLQYVRPTAPREWKEKEPVMTANGSAVQIAGTSFTLSDIFEAMLRHPNGCSRQPITLHYDKSVIGNSIVEAGEADAGVLRPLTDLQSYVLGNSHPGWENLPQKDEHVGAAFSCSGNGRYGKISPYWQGANAVTESIRNCAAVGALPRCLTDCLNYGNPEVPQQLWELEEGVRGIADAARGIAVDGEPVGIVSGNVSLYKCRPDGSAIDPTAIVACVGQLPDARKAVTMQLCEPDVQIYLIGNRKDECGASLYYSALEQLLGKPWDSMIGCNVPQPVFADVLSEVTVVTKAIEAELVAACHDISEGGLLMSAFDMTLPQRGIDRGIGIELNIAGIADGLRSDTVLFSETGGFLCAVKRDYCPAFETLCKEYGVNPHMIGSSTSASSLVIRSGEEVLVEEPLSQLQEIHKTALKQHLQQKKQ